MIKKANNYLEVPFAQKDEAKALGAKWDPVKKKWFASGDMALALFTKWLPTSGIDEVLQRSAKPKVKISQREKNVVQPVRTHPLDKNFIAYDGLEPPWVQ